MRNFLRQTPFLRILAAASFKTKDSLLNNHLWANLDPLLELEIHPSFLVCSFPSLPDLPPSLQVCFFSSLLLLFPSCVGNHKVCQRCSTKPYSSCFWLDFQHRVRTAFFFLFPPFQKLISSDPDGTLSPDKPLGNSPPLAALLRTQSPLLMHLGAPLIHRKGSRLLLLLGCTIPSPLPKEILGFLPLPSYFDADFFCSQGNGALKTIQGHRK